MFNNKLERKQFLLSSKNWELAFKKEELDLTISKLSINNNVTIYKIIFKTAYMNCAHLKGNHDDITYRVKINDSISENVNMTYLIDLLGKI